MKHEDLKISFFDELADAWDGMATPPSADHLSDVVSLAGVRPPASVLDVGCGTGVLAPAILKSIGDKGQLIAIDPASRMLDILKKKYPDVRIETRCEPMETCSLRDLSLDAIIFFSCFPHVSDKPVALSNARRMLKSGGRLVVAHASSRDEINAFHSSCSGPVRHDTLPDEPEMRRLIEDAGFSIIHFMDQPGRYELAAVK